VSIKPFALPLELEVIKCSYRCILVANWMDRQ